MENVIERLRESGRKIKFLPFEFKRFVYEDEVKKVLEAHNPTGYNVSKVYEVCGEGVSEAEFKVKQTTDGKVAYFKVCEYRTYTFNEVFPNEKGDG